MSISDGVGRAARTRLEVEIPAGIDSGMRVRSAGNGEPENGGPPGRSLLTWSSSRMRFSLVMAMIYTREVLMSFVTATLGGTLTVPTLNGKGEIKILKARRRRKCSACVARVLRVFAQAIQVIYIVTWWLRRQFV